MRIRKVLHSKMFWGGAIAGYLGGGWAVAKAKGLTGGKS